MIVKRISSLLLDFLFSLSGAYGAHLGGVDFLYALLGSHLLTQIAGLLYFKGRTAGMVLLRIHPENVKDGKPGLAKLVFYHFVVSIIVVNSLNPSYNTWLESFIPILVLFPFYDSKNYNSALDLIFRIHWSTQQSAGSVEVH